MRPGYCYGSKVIYADHQFYHQLWEEIYDSNLKLWKIVAVQMHPAEIMPGQGPTPYPSELVEQLWDVQNDHASHVFSANPDGKTTGIRYNSDVPRLYDDINKYSTPGGLMTIMK